MFDTHLTIRRSTCRAVPGRARTDYGTDGEGGFTSGGEGAEAPPDSPSPPPAAPLSPSRGEGGMDIHSRNGNAPEVEEAGPQRPNLPRLREQVAPHQSQSVATCAFPAAGTRVNPKQLWVL